jgi:hypothetical protein
MMGMTSELILTLLVKGGKAVCDKNLDGDVKVASESNPDDNRKVDDNKFLDSNDIHNCNVALCFMPSLYAVLSWLC